MDSSLATFLEKGLEFIVGGAIFLASCFFLLFVLGWDPATHLPDQLHDVSNGLLVTLVLIGAYAAGVIVESLCRYLFEWDLKRITVRHQDFIRPDQVTTVSSPRSLTEWALGRRNLGTVSAAGDETAESPADGEEAPGTPGHWALLEVLRRPTGRVVKRLGGYYTTDSCSVAERERERQRLAVAMSAFDGLQADVESQLKRLRLERIASLSGLMVCLGFVIQHAWWPLLASLVIVAMLIRVVHGRFRRFCNAISRGYRLTSSAKAS